jgi:hypothetical protein
MVGTLVEARIMMRSAGLGAMIQSMVRPVTTLLAASAATTPSSAAVSMIYWMEEAAPTPS